MLTYDVAIKNARLTATRDQVAGGTLEIMAADNTVLAIFALTSVGGSVTAGVWTFAFNASTVTGQAAAGSGTNATKAQIKDSTAAVRITGLTVGLSGTDIIFDNVNIASGQNVTLNSATVTHA